VKQDLEYYYQSVFDEAEFYSFVRRWFLAVMLLLIFLSTYMDGKYLYYLALGMFAGQFSLWLLAHRVITLYSLGHSFQKQFMLSDLAIKTMDVGTIEDQKQKTSNFVKKKVEAKRKKHTKKNEILKNKEVLHSAKLRRLIHENAYFNYHLFGKVYNRNLFILFVFCALSLFFLFVFIPSVNSDSDLLVMRLAFSVLSFSLLYEFLTLTLRYRATKKEMKDIDNYLTQAPAAKESVLLESFTRYVEAKGLTPNIPNKIWEKNKAHLQKGWRSRQMKVVYELCDKLSEVGEPWAITGGANHYIRGVVAELNDVDIITNKRGGELISEILKEYAVSKYAFSECGAIKSYFCMLDYKSIQVEVMADPVNLIEGHWEENKEWMGEIEKSNFDGFYFCLTTLDYEIFIYNKLGNLTREKELILFKESKE